MTLEEIVAQVRRKARPITSLELWQIKEANQLSVTGSHFGGHPYAESGDEWPTCQTCDKELPFLGQLDYRQGAHEKLLDADLLLLFYSHECTFEHRSEGCWAIRAYANPHPSKYFRIEPVEITATETPPCKVETKKGLNLPSEFDLAELQVELKEIPLSEGIYSPNEILEIVRKGWSEVVESESFLGGYPQWVGDRGTYPTCRKCKGTMQFVAQIGTEGHAHLEWGDGGRAFLFACHSHQDQFEVSIQIQ